MAHARTDSAMTHSSRRSYKEKYLAARSGIPEVEEHTRTLSDISELQAVQELNREELHSLLREVAEATSDLVALLDSKDGQLGFKVKDIRKPTDANLPFMDGKLIARRTRDVIRQAHSRVGMAGLGLNDMRDALQNMTVGVSLLKPQIAKVKRGVMESYVVGANPKTSEIESAVEDEGKNPRLQDYTYETDKSDSDDEDYDDNSRSLVPATPKRFAKPAGRSPESRRRQSSDDIDIS